MVLGSARWDKNKYLESNLHVCSRDNTKAGIYNIERRTKGRRGKKKKIRTGTLVQFYYSTNPYDTNY